MKSHVLRLLIILICWCASLLPSFATGAGSFRDIKMTPDRDLEAEARGELRADAQEASRILRVESLVEKLREAKRAGITDTSQLPRPVQQARLLCLWKIFVAMEEVRKVVGVINRELSISYTALDSLTTKTNMTTNTINTVNFMQGGVLGCISQGVNFHYGQPITSKTIATVTFSIGTGLAAVGLFAPSLWSRRIGPPANTLAHVFREGYLPPDANRSYLWRFVSSPIPGSNTGLTRREILIKHWEAFSGLDSKNQNRLTRLSAMPLGEEKLSESIRIVTQRIDLLHDLKTHLEEFDGSLFELHNAITIN
jgi:hypothetical protein